MVLNHSHLPDHLVFGGEDLGILELDTVLPVEHQKVKFYPRTGHEIPEGEWRNSCTLSLMSVWVVCATPRPLYPGAIWTGAKNFVPTRI